ncbi:glycosyltransferase 61 family protein [Corynebacterium glutamicum]|uniref:glycosyltransferase 61 family protein n=1 Tax=Corynebacterium glutamicum TaxID=1718 RepID=UPI00117E51BF|nr:glycosyltransferase family 61 protein [Corynebacterium glutamicum]QDQ19942.1 glycosyltransferase family 61 protein [Corynebacterium glutamicum]QDQ23509.1 glycosyltransferase family 61 protein [Corynebacterium glutamicum]
MRFQTSSNVFIDPQVAKSWTPGIVPREDIPNFAAFYRWSRERLAPVPGVPPERATPKWTSPYTLRSRVKGEFWYGGLLDDRFGHFLTETMTRVWWHLSNPGHSRRAVFVAVDGSYDSKNNEFTFAELRSWQRQVFEYFNIEDPLIVTSPLELESLLIPEQGALLFSDIHEPEYQSILSDHATSVLGAIKPERKLFLTRPETISGAVIGEKALAQAFERSGYEIISTEKLPFIEQLQTVRNATYIVASQGSALHLFNVLGKVPSTKVLLFQRLGDYSSSAFASTLGPYVGSLDISMPMARIRSGRSTNHDQTIVDILDVEQKTRQFDPSVSLIGFSSNKYLEEILDGIKRGMPLNKTIHINRS